MDIGYFLVASVLCGLFSLWLTGWIFRGANNPQARWRWFGIIWVIAMVLSYIPT